MNTIADILVVDDTPANLRLLTGMLREQGYEARPFPTGALALRAVQSSPPDLILLDVNMPDLDGYEVCRRLKADEKMAGIPVIFISALDEVIDKVTAFGVGGVDYITKPFHFEEVLARIETHLTLQRVQNQLKESNKGLEAFAHTISHDLKNPLGLVIGYSEYLKEEIDEMEKEEILELLTHVEKAGRKMTSMIDSILLFARVRQDDFEVEPLDMGEIVDQVQDRMAYMIGQHEAELQVPESWPVAYGYGGWVEEVWANYVSNAIKYGGEPPAVSLGATPTRDGQICFWVRDNGQGLSEEAQSKLFREFSRLDEAKAMGHGLGLSIVKQIVQKLGGDVGVRSAVGEGSEFYFTLPAQPVLKEVAFS